MYAMYAMYAMWRFTPTHVVAEHFNAEVPQQYGAAPAHCVLIVHTVLSERRHILSIPHVNKADESQSVEPLMHASSNEHKLVEHNPLQQC